MKCKIDFLNFLNEKTKVLPKKKCDRLIVKVINKNENIENFKWEKKWKKTF